MADWLLQKGSRDKRGEPTRVKDSSWLLKGHNAFGHVWYQGDLTGVVDDALAEAYRQCKFDIGYKLEDVKPVYGSILRGLLVGDIKPDKNMRARAAERKAKFIWPIFNGVGTLIGFPGQGTHSYTYPPNNWESDNAYDIGVAYGSKVVAVADGVIGPSFGSLGKGGRFAGLRCHLETADNEFYYAHLNKFATAISPGVHVKQGQLLGYSGEANGVNHLHMGMETLVQISNFKKVA
jgi:hypothetical protein